MALSLSDIDGSSNYLRLAPWLQRFVSQQEEALQGAVSMLLEASGMHTILVTSAHRGEGKSLTATALAEMLRRGQEKKVLLADANLIAPALYRFFGALPKPGLTDLIALRDPFRRAGRLTSARNLYLLPHGTPSNSPEEIYASPFFPRLLEGLKEHFEYLVFDAPSLLDAPEFHPLLPLFDGILLVAEERRTLAADLSRARTLLDEHGAPLTGVVLNRRGRQ